MEMLLCHLVGDYILQTDWMAKNKRTQLWPAAVHAIIYVLVFDLYQLLSTGHILTNLQYIVIGGTHYFIDRYALARYVIFGKNWLTDQSLKWSECNKTGYPNTMPEWLSVWLLIITDNTLHLLFNYIALTYL